MIKPEIYASASSTIEVVQVTDDNHEDIINWTRRVRQIPGTRKLELRLPHSDLVQGTTDNIILGTGDYIAKYEDGRVDFATPLDLERYFRKLSPEDLASRLIVHSAVRKPNPVETVRVTDRNTEELARWCGGVAGWLRGPNGIRRLSVMVPGDEDRGNHEAYVGMYILRQEDGSFIVRTAFDFEADYNITSTTNHEKDI